jgi:DNA-binding response OmpR family regulator
MALIALIEDDAPIRNSLQIGLRSKGLELRSFNSVEDFFEKETGFQSYDLFLVDLVLPGASGERFCERLRQQDPWKPLVILTARTEERAAVSAFLKGADDFVRKPLGVDELFVRIQRLLGRHAARGRDFRFEELLLNSQDRSLGYRDQVVPLTSRECSILTLFLKNPGEVISRERILSLIDEEAQLSERTLDSHVSNIRKKLTQLGASHLAIRSLYGIGYRIEVEK